MSGDSCCYDWCDGLVGLLSTGWIFSGSLTTYGFTWISVSDCWNHIMSLYHFTFK